MCIHIPSSPLAPSAPNWDNGLCISKIPKGRGSQLDVRNLMVCLFVQDTARDFDLRWRHAELEQEGTQRAHPLRRAEFNRPDPIFGSPETNSIAYPVVAVDPLGPQLVQRSMYF